MEGPAWLRWPGWDAEVLRTAEGTPYLCDPGVVVLAQSVTNVRSLSVFLEGYGLDFGGYVSDKPLEHLDQLAKVAGQLCYMSFGEARTPNADAARYLTNIKEQAHGSTLEHSSVTLLLYGVSRSLTHELVRHRAGFAFSQVSQRYVGGKTLRFVERPEYRVNLPEAPTCGQCGEPWAVRACGPTHALCAMALDLHRDFERRIDAASEAYSRVATLLATRLGEEDGIAKTDRLKAVRQVARSLLPNETEAPIVVTANLRAWRHFLEMRGSRHAETEMRRVAVRVLACLRGLAPLVFDDYREEQYGGYPEMTSRYRKV